MALTHISIRGAKEHNLRGVDIDLPRDQLIVVTGLSGSGKSSLAFDTIYAEGQRRYVESLSAYARQFLGQMEKPNVESIEGLPPTIAIEQRQAGHNPRSTVATTTEIYDHLRLLFARVGKPHCPECAQPVQAQSAQAMVDTIMSWPEGTKVQVLSPVVRGKKGEHREVLARLMRDGYARVRVNGEVFPIQEVPSLDKNKKHIIEIVVDRIVVNAESVSRLTDSVETSLRESEGTLRLLSMQPDESEEWRVTTLSELAFCPEHPEADMAELQPRTFSFNSPYGACQVCHGLGTEMDFDLKLVIQDPALSLAQGAITPWAKSFGPWRKWYERKLRRICGKLDIDMRTPWRDLPERATQALLRGTDGLGFGSTRFEGVLPGLMNQFTSSESDNVKARIMHYMSEHECTACGGGRLRPFALAVTVGEQNISTIANQTIGDALAWVTGLKLSKQDMHIGQAVLKEVKARLGFMSDVGIGYLSLDRKSGTLSGGEAQRIKLATQVGSGLVGVCYVLDEPSIGLHQRDNDMLIRTLRHLRDIGNTVIVVEHDEDTIRSADYLVDIGPGAGEAGGRIVYAGEAAGIESANTLTADFLSGREEISIPEKRRAVNPQERAVIVKGATQNNLRNVTAAFPLGGVIAVTGVSGSGKSTLVSSILAPALANRLNNASLKIGACESVEGMDSLDKVIEIDQSPIGRTPRSNTATYTDIFSGIRDLYTRTREAKLRGYKPGRFSFNVKGGRCEACEGQGVKLIEMHFLPDVHVICEECKGARYNRETLEVKYAGKNIAEVLEMRVSEALVFFENHKKLSRTLQTLHDVGLDYIKLGQPATTLSGGEAQRIKLAGELGRPDTGHTFYILDEPTTGLHFADVRKLLEVLQRLVGKGNTVVVIEHNLDVIKCADWIIDLGPEGGVGGGQIIAEGPPEVIVANEASHTGRYLKRYFSPKTKRATKAAAEAEHAVGAMGGRRPRKAGAKKREDPIKKTGKASGKKAAKKPVTAKAKLSDKPAVKKKVASKKKAAKKKT